VAARAAVGAPARARGARPRADASRPRILAPAEAAELLPPDRERATLRVGEREVQLTNLTKPYFPARGLTKGDLLRYYLAIAPLLLPHLADRAIVLRRYPHGAGGPSFFMKRAPTARPSWLRTCRIAHDSGTVIDYAMIDDVASLLWCVNLGSIDLHPFYARCDDPWRPDVLNVDLDPVEGTPFARVREAALAVRDALARLSLPAFAKTTGGRGIHVYVPIERGPTQDEVWSLARELARLLAAERPSLLTTEYRIAKRPKGRVLVDVNQNVWGHTLASVYSVRPQPRATVSMPVTWEEIAAGVRPEDFELLDAHERVRARGDLWAPVLASRGRARLDDFFPERRRA
jgi:bifunctional non-homologous end joining protein LigD